MVYCSGLWLSTVMYIFTISFYKAFMPTTDIIWRWKAPSVLADILAYNVPQHTTDIDVIPALPGDTLVQGVVTDTMELIVVESVVGVDESIGQGVVTEAVEPVVVVESFAVLMVPEASLVPAATMPLDSPPNEETIRARPTRSAPIVTQAQSNLIIVTAFVQLVVIVMVASVVAVLGRPSRSSKHLSIPILAPACDPSPSPIGRSTSFFALSPAVGVFIAQYLSDKPSLAVNILRSLSVGLVEHCGMMVYHAIISVMSSVFERGKASQESGIGEGEIATMDILRADCAEQDTASLLVLNLEAINNTASLLSGNLTPSNGFDLFDRPAEVDMSFDIPKAQDTSVYHELVSAQSIVCLYTGVPEDNSVSIMMIEEMAKVYDALDSIESAILSVSSMDDLQAMISTIPLPSRDDLAQTTDIERVDQSVFDELADETSSSETVSSVSSLWSIMDLRSAPPEWHSALSSPQVFESTGEFRHFDPSWSSEAKASLSSDETFGYRGLPPVDSTEISGSGYVCHEDGVLFMARSSCIRPSNSVLRFSSSRSSFDDLEVEDSFEMPLATPIRKGVPSPSRIPVPSKRRRTSVDLVQVTRSPRTVRQSPSRIPIRSVRLRRSGMDAISSTPSMQPIQRKPLVPPRFLAFAPKMCAQEESGSPARRARRCHGCSQYSPRRTD